MGRRCVRGRERLSCAGLAPLSPGSSPHHRGTYRPPAAPRVRRTLRGRPTGPLPRVISLSPAGTWRVETLGVRPLAGCLSGHESATLARSKPPSPAPKGGRNARRGCGDSVKPLQRSAPGPVHSPVGGERGANARAYAKVLGPRSERRQGPPLRSREGADSGTLGQVPSPYRPRPDPSLSPRRLGARHT